MRTLQDLYKECEIYQAEMETLLPTEINAATERGVELDAYRCRLAQIVADAKYLARRKRSSEISNTIIKIAKENCLSSKAQNALVDSIAEEEMYVVDWSDELSTACSHKMDFCRTIISKEKALMQYTNYR